ncbi:MAG: tetratricopeptide repeat protein [Chloroflexi bacterium]|nr:tetratricopeptide repeat protein [Chloroflexota bacterium]
MEEAIAAFNEALTIQKPLGQPVKIAITIEHLGIIHELQGQYAAALAKYREALALKQQYSSPQQIAIEENHIRRVLGKMGAGAGG